MKNIIKEINILEKDKKISNQIKERIKYFQEIGQSKKDTFLELCFCILTANYQAKKSWEIQDKFKKELLTSNEEELRKILKTAGHRFWPQRAERIVLIRNIKKDLSKEIEKVGIRNWLVKNVKGLGMKESSHFLRNIGKLDYAIIDFHIVDILVKENIIERPKSITPKKYIEIEEELKKIAKKVNLSLGELDLYLWYMETGTILK